MYCFDSVVLFTPPPPSYYVDFVMLLCTFTNNTYWINYKCRKLRSLIMQNNKQSYMLTCIMQLTFFIFNDWFINCCLTFGEQSFIYIYNDWKSLQTNLYVGKANGTVMKFEKGDRYGRKCCFERDHQRHLTSKCCLLGSAISCWRSLSTGDNHLLNHTIYIPASLVNI